MTDDIYTPVLRDRVLERKRCERDIPGYRQERHHPTWSEIRSNYLRELDRLDRGPEGAAG
jgi:hypothetical protein